MQQKPCREDSSQEKHMCTCSFDSSRLLAIPCFDMIMNVCTESACRAVRSVPARRNATQAHVWILVQTIPSIIQPEAVALLIMEGHIYMHASQDELCCLCTLSARFWCNSSLTHLQDPPAAYRPLPRSRSSACGRTARSRMPNRSRHAAWTARTAVSLWKLARSQLLTGAGGIADQPADDCKDDDAFHEHSAAGSAKDMLQVCSRVLRYDKCRASWSAGSVAFRQDCLPQCVYNSGPPADAAAAICYCN